MPRLPTSRMGHTLFSEVSRFRSAVVLLAVLCGKDGLDAQRQTAPEGIRLQRLVSIGGDMAGENAAFMHVSAIGVSRAGQIYVLDSGNRSVRVFDETGRYVSRFGRAGGGPGEFHAPVDIWVDSVVGVSDMTQHRISWFDLAGRHLRTEAAPMAGESPVIRLRPLRHGRAIGVTPSRMGVRVGSAAPTGSPVRAVVVLSARAEPDTLFRMHSGVAWFHPRDAQVPFGTVHTHLGAGGAYAVLADSVVATADGYTGAVRWYRADATGLTLFRTRQLTSRSRPRTEADLRRVERQIRREGPSLPRRLVIEAPERVSIATQALFSDEGMLWVRNTVEAERGHIWTVFDTRGEVAYRLQLPAGFELRHVRGDRLYGASQTPNGSPVVQVYRLVRAG